MKNFTIFSLLILSTLFAQSQQNQTLTQNVCAGTTENYNVITSLTASTFAWSISPASGGSITGTGNNINISWGTTTGTYTVQVIETSADGCIGNAKTVAISIKAAPTANAGSNQTICAMAGTTITLSGASVSNAVSQSWATNGSGSFIDNTVVQAVYTITAADIIAGSKNFTLTVVGNTPCGNALSTVVYTIVSAPTLTVSNNGAVCETNALSLSSNITGATYNWTGPNGFIATTQSPSVSANSTLGMLGTYNLTVSSIPGGCPSLTASTAVIVHPKPTTSGIWHN